MRKPAMFVEQVAEVAWGALLVLYLISARRPEYLSPTVLGVFGLSAAAAGVDVLLRRRQWRWINAYDSLVFTVLLSAMVAVTGGRGSEVWPAYMLMALTAPSMGRPVLHFGLMGANSLIYTAIYTWINPYGAPFVWGLLLLRIGLFFLVTYLVDLYMARQRAAMKRAVQASRERVSELVSARDAERKRIAGDIHDWLGTGLVAPMRRLELAMRAPDSDAARARLDESLAMLRRSHEELRRLMADLHPHLLEQMGLTEALHAYLQSWGEEHGVAVAFTGDSAPQPPAPVALATFRILQETLNNTAKHADASRVTATLALRAQGLTLTVTDDGRGFDPSAPGARLPAPAVASSAVSEARPAVPNGLAPAGRGLTGMRERAEAFGGTVAIDSRSNRGTTVVARIPYRGEVQ